MVMLIQILRINAHVVIQLIIEWSEVSRRHFKLQILHSFCLRSNIIF